MLPLHLAITPENILTAFAALTIFAGALWLQHWMERRGIK